MLVMYLKVHETERGKVIAVCDSDLIGKVLDDGKIFMDLDKNRSFYVGSFATKDEVCAALKSFNSINFVGKKCTKILISLDLVASASIEKVCGVPFVQIYEL